MQPVDQHTLYELQVLAERKGAFSALQFFDKTLTQGGSDYLKTLLSKPRSTLAEVQSFQQLIKTILEKPATCLIDIPRSYIMAAEGYSSLSVAHSMSQDAVMHWLDTLVYYIKSPEEFYRIQSGLMATLRMLRAMQRMLVNMQDSVIPQDAQDDVQFISKFLSTPTIRSFLKQNENDIAKTKVFSIDYYFRVSNAKALRRLLDIFYRFDAYRSIAKTTELHRLTFPDFDNATQKFAAAGIKHPLIPNGIANDIHIDLNKSVCIITGANTSGKTTFLKACGLAIYLAHLGLPVPATNITLPFFDRLFTSIHLADDLTSGYSHFYNEMMRVKSIAEALQQGDRCFVLVDEIFRGTNQEDAFHCSKTVLDGFCKYPGSYFMISTHLLELAEGYMDAEFAVNKCFKTTVLGEQFKNSFKIADGIAYERVGSLIMNAVGITSIFEKAKRLPQM
ncbi:DNA mismatch repair protein MutS [Dyadobacter sp. CECT 9623]|uniref:DNA mismatch repair protein MutS n=1 Tax=Dyadobacter linearis TaxID=2823330 RepID=A0ABM8UUG6_9BACT|nr:DNA mismatch repair protein MutS [Dyadobacter sp. CECT 9623]CAG5071938.1 DNA mismatch repair protein MutS [Dyadobacter sp. CECT 9623]